MPPSSRHTVPASVAALRFLLALILFGVASCGGETPSGESPPTLEREAFIQAYVELREAEVLSGQALSDSLRSAVLERRGVTEEELLRFAEIHGTDIAYMRDVWGEVERRLDERSIPLDSVGGS